VNVTMFCPEWTDMKPIYAVANEALAETEKKRSGKEHLQLAVWLLLRGSKANWVPDQVDGTYALRESGEAYRGPI
jgi:hypothetical protein